MSGGVRNLRAMFENKDQSTSPPQDRGRSPGSANGLFPSGIVETAAKDLQGSIAVELHRDHSRRYGQAL